jgi:N-acetylglucosaminyl-diphospho-decaprenol L-rhamnosyltransferase
VSSDAESGPTAVVVVNYRSHGLIRDNLAPLALGDGFRVVLVDNRSTSEEAAAVRSLAAAAGWDAIELETNDGFASGVNAGLRHAFATGCTSAVLLNPDVVVTESTLEALRRHVTTNPTDVVSPVVRSPARAGRGFSVLDLRHGAVRAEAATRLRRGDSSRTERWLPATCLAVHRELLTKTGELADEYFMYWEDIDLCRRCATVGGTLVLRDDLEVYHAELGTQQRATPAAKSALYYRYNCRNRLVFAARNLARRDVLRWMLWTPVVSWRVLMQGGRRQLVASPRLLWAAVRGSVEGLAVATRALVDRR